ncbi:hypothetical protein H5410_060020 [Solanum commersonii]|uniref:Uncharacterized protein n=1 Tax=Solanum commersonii TaxID=4109 RepID=A0A9J5W599_SOLCO|nr:hypothetical protein H5410_060020 [Solanum commersonii]
MTNDSPKIQKISLRLATNPSVSIWAAQCGKCFKWRTISILEEFEEIRSSPTIMDDTIPTTALLANSNMKVQKDTSIARFTFCEEGFD